MQKELVRRRGIAEIMEKPELLEKIEPNLELVKTLLTHRELLNSKTRILARKIIDKVVEGGDAEGTGPSPRHRRDHGEAGASREDRTEPGTRQNAADAP